MRPKLTGGRRLDACLRLFSLLARDESGIALVMALGIMLVLTIALTTVAFMTTAGQRDAQRTNAGQKAYALAEAGINNAMSVLTPYYSSSSISYNGSSGTTNPCLLDVQAITYSGQDGTSAAQSCGNPSPFTSTYTTGTTTWSGMFQTVSGSDWDYQWVIRSTGSVANPTGPGAPNITRTVTAVVPLVPGTAQNSGVNALDWVYGQSVNFNNSSQINAPVYATAGLTLNQGQDSICGSAGIVEVQGNVVLGTQNQIGSVSRCSGSDPKLNEFHVTGTCQWKNQPAHNAPCSAADQIFSNSYSSTLSPTPSELSASFPDATAGLQMARPGPNHNCNSSAPSGTYPWQLTSGAFNFTGSPANPNPINLTPTASYSCKFTVSGTTVGELSWDNTNKLLTVQGNIYLPGTATVTQQAHYEGMALLFLTGGFYMDANGETLCAGKLSGNDCNWGGWNPNLNLLVVYALGNSTQYGNGVQLKNKIEFQGALMANGNINSDTNSESQGPIDSLNGITTGQNFEGTYPSIHILPGGLIGSFTPAKLLLPRNFSGG